MFDKENLMRIEFTKTFGRSYDLQMVALYNKRHLSEAEARKAIQTETENEYITFMEKRQFENIFIKPKDPAQQDNEQKYISIGYNEKYKDENLEPYFVELRYQDNPDKDKIISWHFTEENVKIEAEKVAKKMNIRFEPELNLE